MKVEICLPIYNEEKILEKNVNTLINYCLEKNFGFDWKIVIVINGSKDGSLKISQSLKEKFPALIDYVNFEDPGRGQALKKYWGKSEADIVTYMDIDLAVSLNHLDDLIWQIIEDQTDLTIGSRLLPESKIKRSFIRELSSQTYNFLSRVILGHNFSDMQCGFKAIRKKSLEKIIEHLQEQKWFFDTELILFAKQNGLRIKELPVDWSENRYDERKSKVNLLKDSLKFFYNLIRLKGRLIKTKKRKNKIVRIS